MRLPPNYQRIWVKGIHNGSFAANGWNVRVGNKAAFIPRSCVSHPGRVRGRLEKVLGIDAKPPKTQEEIIVAKSRMRSILRRSFKNKIASGENPVAPWKRPRTLKSIVAEQRTLDIAVRYARMGVIRG